MQLKKKTKVRACSECGQAFFSSYAAKTHSCKIQTGYTSREEALQRIRADRK